MFPFDITKCDATETIFESNGAKYVNICIRDGKQEFNYEIKLDDEDISEIQSLSENN